MNQLNTQEQISILEILDNRDFHRESADTISYSSNTFFYANKYDLYNYKTYRDDIINYGLKSTWDMINHYVLNFEVKNKFLDVKNFAELYEIGLSLVDKYKKKNNGQYYTPYDVASNMSYWLKNCDGYNICDVACGTGNLIMSYLDSLKCDEAEKIIREGRIYLYDIDDVALNICKTIMIKKFGNNLAEQIHYVECDFLDKNITLPNDCKVIANPPYSTVDKLPSTWLKTNVATNTKQLYAMFMEKILLQSKSSVIITPYSFIGGSKFYSLRKIMNNYSGFIISFDNVPGNIFNGKKHGVFNTNTANSVRAAITVAHSDETSKGFALTPLIRFKNKERKELLTPKVLENFIYNKKQTISEKNNMFYKCDKHLGEILDIWLDKSQKNIGNYIDKYGQYVLSMPNTCRYYTTASNEKMKRSGQMCLRFSNKDVYNYTFCLLNSSFAYWFWRLYDGGITFTKRLLLSVPVFFDMLDEEDKVFFENMTEEMTAIASTYVITKKNISVQENIKYPKIYRNKINRRLLDILGIECAEKIFDIIHSNTALEINV